MTSEKAQAAEKQGRNSEAACRSGGVRSSDEAAVMADEQKGTVIQLESREQLREQGDSMNVCD